MKIYVWNEEVFDKVTSGEWTFEQFEAWVQDWNLRGMMMDIRMPKKTLTATGLVNMPNKG